MVGVDILLMSGHIDHMPLKYWQLLIDLDMLFGLMTHYNYGTVVQSHRPTAKQMAKLHKLTC